MSSFKAMAICHYEPIGKNDPAITMFVCWTCEMTCPTNDALKLHVATHGFTRVFCSCCFDQHRYYRRMVDLRQHVKNAHPTIYKKEGEVPFLVDRSGCYLADNPKEYRRAMGSVPLDVTPAALFLKEAVENWCINFKGVVERPLTTWRQFGPSLAGSSLQIRNHPWTMATLPQDQTWTQYTPLT